MSGNIPKLSSSSSLNTNNNNNGRNLFTISEDDGYDRDDSQLVPESSITSNNDSNRAANMYHHTSADRDEEDYDNLFNSMGLLTDHCVSEIIHSTRNAAKSNNQQKHNFNESTQNMSKSTTEQQNSQSTTPPRSWNVKLHASRSYVIPTPSSSKSNESKQIPLQTTSLYQCLPKKQKYPNIVDLSSFPNSLIAEENFNFVSVEHADTSFPVFLELWKNEQVCDVTIIVGDRRFSAHRIILCATIPYFYAMFTNDVTEKNATEIVLQSPDDCSLGTPSLEADAFEALLRYAYTGSITINSHNVQSILIGASFLALVNVQQACADYLRIRLNVSNVLNVKSFAFALGCDNLVVSTKKYIHRHFEEISRTDDFLRLDFEEVIDIIGKDELNIKGEEIVFEAIMAWTKNDEEKRQEHLPALLANVRLPLLTPEYLTDTVMLEKLIRCSIACRDLVDEAKDYHLLPARRELMQRFRTRPRFGHHIQGLIYAVGGLTKSGDSMSTVEVYDPQLNRWRIAEAMTMLRSRVGVAVMDGKLYAIGGYNGKERLNTVELYDSKLKRWQKVPVMGQRRSAVGAAPLNGFLYVCGGYDGTTSLNAVERYSPSNDRWYMMSSMNFHRSAAGVVSFDGYIYALGGHDGLMIFNSVERYDPRTDRWEIVEPMLTRRCRLGVTTFGGKIYVCGGYDGCTFLQTAEVYDPNLGRWSYIAPMRITRSRVALVANCGRLFAIGGYDGITNLSSVEMYDIENDCWEFSASMVAHEGGVGVGVIPDN